MAGTAYSDAQVQSALAQLPGWHLNSKGEIECRFQFEDFVQSLAFVNKVGSIAEEMGHHPDIVINYNKVSLSLTTHDAGGLTKNDFDLAARANQLAE
jgi:4a-hydroxytetrahydrobiopterin dehydratase